MQKIDEAEQRWLESFRQASDRVFVGLDHHSRQVTIAAGSGSDFFRSTTRDGGWIPTAVFEQDGPGYEKLLQWLDGQFSGVPRDRFTFLAEPTFAKPFGRYMVRAGFDAREIKWVRTSEVAPYRKAKGIGKAGKNDWDDARAMAMMAFDAAASPVAGRSFLPGVRESARAEGLGRLAADYWRLSEQSVRLQNQIWDLVVRLFPECWRIWNRSETVLKPDGSQFERQKMSLFRTSVPMQILSAFPGARAVAEAGFDTIWATISRQGVRPNRIRALVSLAEQSSGIHEPLDSERLRLLIGEYRDVRSRLGVYVQSIQDAVEADPVLSSLRNITCLSPQFLGVILGALGDVSRFPDVDAVKRYLNIAPVPMPQTGTVDPLGRPVQIWRLPANTYERKGGQKKLVYRIRGRQDVRIVLYCWFQYLVWTARLRSDDPFVKLYLRLKEEHQGQPRWFAKARWKVAAKLIGVIFHCLRRQEAYDPAKLRMETESAE